MTDPSRIRPRCVLFLCTGNSARSQMAEGFARGLFPEGVEVHSAGITPVGVNPCTIAVMAESGVDIRSQYSKGFSDIPMNRIDTVITLCGHAQAYCPTFPRPVEQLHWPIDDPVGFRGKPEQAMKAFRKARDEIRTRVTEFAKRLGEVP
jgi:arsenate reductase